MEVKNMPTFTNQAQISYKGIITNSNVATGEIIEVLSATQNAVLNDYTAGGEVTYFINLINTGTTPYTDLTVEDNLGAYEFQPSAGASILLYPLTYVEDSIHYILNGVEQPAPAVTAANGLTLTGITVPAGGTTTLIYQTRTNEDTPLAPGAAITNTAVISGGDLGTPLEVSATVTVQNAPLLTIFKSISPRQVPANGQVTYTFDIRNLGNTATTVEDNVIVLDTFSPILTDITVSYNGAVLSETDYTYSELTGEFATNAGVVNVPAATFVQNPVSGAWTAVPGEATLVITGTIYG